MKFDTCLITVLRRTHGHGGESPLNARRFAMAPHRPLVCAFVRLSIDTGRSVFWVRNGLVWGRVSEQFPSVWYHPIGYHADRDQRCRPLCKGARCFYFGVSPFMDPCAENLAARRRPRRRTRIVLVKYEHLNRWWCYRVYSRSPHSALCEGAAVGPPGEAADDLVFWHAASRLTRPRPLPLTGCDQQAMTRGWRFHGFRCRLTCPAWP